MSDPNKSFVRVLIGLDSKGRRREQGAHGRGLNGKHLYLLLLQSTGPLPPMEQTSSPPLVAPVNALNGGGSPGGSQMGLIGASFIECNVSPSIVSFGGRNGGLTLSSTSLLSLYCDMCVFVCALCVPCTYLLGNYIQVR